MLNTIIENKRYAFETGPLTWEEAIKKACQPLVESGDIEPEYSSYIIHNVHEFGPYIVIAPDVCIPHAQEGRGVNRTAIGFMNVDTPVDFGPDAEYTAQLFFVLASTDNEQHLANLSELVMLLSDEEVIERLKSVRNVEELKAVQESLGE